MLEAGTVSSWPASYHLVPLTNSRMLDPEGKEILVPLQEPGFWEQNKLGLLREKAEPSLAAARQSYMEAQIRGAARFQEMLRLEEPAPGHLKLLHVRGRGRPTLAKGYFDGKEFVFLPRDAEKKKLPFAPLEEEGDGSIPLAATISPASFAAKEIFTNFAHDRLFDDPAVEKECLDFFAGEN